MMNEFQGTWLFNHASMYGTYPTEIIDWIEDTQNKEFVSIRFKDPVSQTIETLLIAKSKMYFRKGGEVGESQ